MHPPNCHLGLKSHQITTLQKPLQGSPSSLTTESIPCFSKHCIQVPPGLSVCPTAALITLCLCLHAAAIPNASHFLVTLSRHRLSLLSFSPLLSMYLVRFRPKVNCSKNFPWSTSPHCPCSIIQSECSLPRSHNFLWMTLLLFLLHISVSFLPQLNINS